jgi:predicted RNase H-like HicB family nuclease
MDTRIVRLRTLEVLVIVLAALRMVVEHLARGLSRLETSADTAIARLNRESAEPVVVRVNEHAVPTLFYQDEDGTWIAEALTIPGCFSQGRTLEEARNNVREAIEGCLEVRAERGLPLTVEANRVHT